MRRFFLVVLFLCCLAAVSDLTAQTLADYVKRAQGWSGKGDYDLAIAACNQAFAVADPNDPKESKDISKAYTIRGEARRENHEDDKAKADFNRALAFDPYNGLAYVNRGAARSWSREGGKAIADFDRALAINPRNALAYRWRGLIWQLKGDYGKAIADYRQALAIDPSYEDVSDRLAWIYAACPEAKYRNGKKAVELASKASQLSGGEDSSILDTLAAAWAESGDFAKARELEAKAIDLAPESNKAWMRPRLDLFKQGKPYRMESSKK